MSEVRFDVTNARGDVTSVTGKGISVARSNDGGRVVKFNPVDSSRTSVAVYLTPKQATFLVNACAYTAENLDSFPVTPPSPSHPAIAGDDGTDFDD